MLNTAWPAIKLNMDVIALCVISCVYSTNAFDCIDNTHDDTCNNTTITQLFDGEIVREIKEEALAESFVPAEDFVKAIDENPMVLNLGALGAAYESLASRPGCDASPTLTPQVPSCNAV